MSKNKKRAAKQTGYSPLESHRREGKSFVPPLMQHGKTVLMSWRDTRVPEILWAILLIGNLERNHCLSIFRSLVQRAVASNQPQPRSLSHSFLAADGAAVFDRVFGPLCQDGPVSHVLSSLLVLNKLPDRAHWECHLSAPDPSNAWHALGRAVAVTTDHQSQESTDCRWLRLLFEVSRGSMHLHAELATEIIEYPDIGDMRKVRPLVRSSEVAIDQPYRDSPPGRWPEDFWEECWQSTGCTAAHRLDEERFDAAEVAKELATVYGEVVLHFRRTLATTSIDARHDAVFGLVLYGLNLGYSVCFGSAHHRVEGRMAIRSMAECYITLAFLLKRDQAALWDKYRRYGSGQAKLAYLKSFDLDDPSLPNYVNVPELEAMANEDAWLEFVSIDVGHWAALDLRQMSQDANAKPIYDKDYSWPSGYVHGHWGAVRDTNFGICLNPLHRYHRIPTSPKISMASIAPAVAKLGNLLLDALNSAYPTFKTRIRQLSVESSEAVNAEHGELPDASP